MYITEDTGDIFVDIATANTATIGENRIQLNANQATYIRKKVVQEDGTILIQTIDYDDVVDAITSLSGLNVDYTRLKEEVLGPPVLNEDTGLYTWDFDNSRIDQLETRMITAQEDIITINNTKIPELEQNLDDLEKALDAEIKARQNGDKNLQDQINIIDDTLTGVQTIAADAQTKANNALNNISELRTEQSTQNTNINNAQKDATDALSQLTDLTPRVKTNEDNIAALQENDRNLNDKFNNYLPLTGGKLTGSLIMDVNQTITIPNQPGENDNTLAVNKLYVDNSITDAKNDLTTKYQAADNQINANITALDTKIGNNTTAISNLTTKHNEDIESLSGEIENKSTVIFREWGD